MFSFFQLPFQLPSISLPSIALPASIQRRFIGFILRRSLGNFVKPGQLDGDQVNAQLGSGFVEINNLELDGEAINQSLIGLPVKLQEGVIGSVAVTVPFQNILSASLTIVVDQLDLSLVLQKAPPPTPYSGSAASAEQLASSVVSVAQEFIHEELDAPSLRESIAHNKESASNLPSEDLDDDMSTHIPGSLDPFVKQVLQPKVNQAIEKDEGILDDEEGVSMLTQVVEMVLSRLSFTVSKITVKIIHEGTAEMILEIKKVEYGAEAKSETTTEGESTNITVGRRTIRIHGVDVSLRDLQADASTTVEALSRQTSNALQLSDVPASEPLSDMTDPEPVYREDDAEEEMDASMTQSMISLPPPNELPSGSPSSTMFFSAASIRAHTPPPIQELDNPSESPLSASHNDIISDSMTRSTPKIAASGLTLPTFSKSSATLILSFGHEPIVLTLSTPARTPIVPADSSAAAPIKEANSQIPKLSVKIGLFTVALQSVHINSLLAMADFAMPNQSPSRQSTLTPKASPSFFSTIQVSSHLKAIHLFLFKEDYPPSESTIDDIFNHPTSAVVKAPCLRVQVEAITLLMTPGVKGAVTARGHVKDLSIFLIYMASPRQNLPEQMTEEKWIASPVLLVDHHMSSQYDHSQQLQEFKDTTRIPVIDWTDPSTHSSSSGRPKRSLWRSRPPAHTPSKGDKERVEMPEAVTIQMEISKGKVDVGITPLHFFVDTRMIGWILAFSQQIVREDKNSGLQFDIEEEAVARKTLGRGFKEFAEASPKRKHRSPSDTPRFKTSELPSDDDARRFADAFLADTDTVDPNDKQATGTRVRCAMIRFELRCSSPTGAALRSGYQSQRSGPFVLDLNELCVTVPKQQEITRESKRARFASESSEEVLPLAVTLEWRSALAFYAGPKESKAVPFMNMGSASVSQSISSPTVATGARPASIHVRTGTLPNPASQTSKSRSTAPPSSTTVVEISVPSFSASLTKDTLDGLQLWADDMAQWADRAFSGKASTEGSIVTSSQATSRGQSTIIGSRYFVQRTASNVGEEEEIRRSDLVIRMGIDDANVQLCMKRGEGDVRPFEIIASDIQTTVQVKPEGRDETVVIVSVLDAIIRDSPADKSLTLLALTLPRRLLAPAPPVLQLRLDSISLPDSKAKQSKIQVTASKFTYTLHPDFSWIFDLARFIKAPPGAFEQVIPSERTILHVHVKDGSINVLPPNHPGRLVLNLDDISVNTELINGSPDASVTLLARSLNILLLDDIVAPPPEKFKDRDVERGYQHWVKSGYAPILHASDLHIVAFHSAQATPPRSRVEVSDTTISFHLCADTLPTLTALAGDLATLVPASEPPPEAPKVTAIEGKRSRRDMSKSIFMDENAFRQPPAIGAEPDMIEDDLPSNLDFIDASYGSAAGARPLTPDDLEDYDEDGDGRLTPTLKGGETDKIVSNMGGETIRMLTKEGIHIIEGYYDELPPESTTSSSNDASLVVAVRIRRSRLHVHLHSGYDWHRTRKTIEEEVKAIRRRLEKIRQLLAKGQTLEGSNEKTSAVLYNSVYLGLDADMESLEGQDLVAAIEANLADEYETASQESWQSLPVTSTHQRGEVKNRRKKTRTRSKASEVEIAILGLNADVDKYGDGSILASRVLATVKDLKILDHMKTSTWDKFLTSMRIDSRGNKRETDSDMVRLELKMVRPEPTLPNEEARLRAKILPIRLHVDQDALDFLKQFFSFQDTDGFQPAVPPTPGPEIFFQHVEIFPVELKLDYKPKRVDYKALKEGRTIELMNFFHFEDAEMTLRRITLTGLTGWARLGDTLNDMWTPDVKANQLADVISGVAPIRSIVNVGTGVADLLLLPIAQYKKDKRLFRGVQKGTAAFMRTTAMETIKLGARLATGTQVILEHAEHVLGAGGLQDGQPFGATITTETIPSPILSSSGHPLDGQDGDLLLDEPIDDAEDRAAMISRYSAQPEDVREGIQAAYKSLSKNLNAAAQTILAVPMEVYEQSGSGGPVRAVVRAVPIAVIKPMIGATEAASKTLFGFRNALDPEIIQENVDKYKAAS